MQMRQESKVFKQEQLGPGAWVAVLALAVSAALMGGCKSVEGAKDL